MVRTVIRVLTKTFRYEMFLFEGGITGQVVDLFGTSTSGSLLIPVSQTMGMFVASQKTEIVNTAVLNEIAVSTIYQAFHLMDNGDRVSASLALCEAPGATTILGGDSCFISIDATAPERVEVWLESETFARSVPITVWNPENAKMLLDRDTIYPIEGACNMVTFSWHVAFLAVTRIRRKILYL